MVLQEQNQFMQRSFFMSKFKTDYLVKSAMIAALYVAVTFVFQPISYGQIQFRISEILVLFAFIDSKYWVGLTIGCAIANFFGPFGPMDVIFGTSATFLALMFIIKIRKILGSSIKSLFISSFGPVIFNGVIIGIELNYLLGLPLIPSMIYVALGEFVVVSIVGVFVFSKLLHNKRFIDIISFK